MPSTNGHGHKRAVLYCRVSGEEQRKKGYSLADQLDTLRRWCSENEYEVVDEIEDGATPALTWSARGWTESERW